VKTAPPAKVQARVGGRAVEGEVIPPEPKAPSKAKAPAKSKRASSHRVGRGGDGEHIPDDRSRQIVEAMASYGIPHPDIARLVGAGGICEPTLRKHYRRELDTARGKLNAKLMESLVAQALGHPALYDEKGLKVRDEQKRYAPAAMWLLRRQDALDAQALEAEARAQEVAQHAMRDRLKMVFEHANPDEIEVLQRVFGRVSERLAEVART